MKGPRIIVVNGVLNVGVITEVLLLTGELILSANIIAYKLRHQFEVRKAVVKKASAVGGKCDDEECQLLERAIAVGTLHD